MGRVVVKCGVNLVNVINVIYVVYGKDEEDVALEGGR